MGAKRHRGVFSHCQSGLPNSAQDRRRLWRKALIALSGPALRLHHYRDVRTRLLRDALDVGESWRCDPPQGPQDSACNSGSCKAGS